MEDSFLTIEKVAEGLYTEKRSKFISFAIPVNTIEDVQCELKTYQKKYFDARHVCYAYILGNDGETSRSSDDREPSGTAGRPILGQLRSQNLTNILLIVVRYFGGTELGAANLGRAYKTAAADALTKAQIKEIVIMDSLVFESPYTEIDRAMRIARDLGGKIVSQTYADQSVKLKVNIRSGKIAELKKKLSAIYTIKFLK
ncbi:YigZ family protein [Alloprevotella tannerae]|uniref:YigZ family protein n=1 Tax=Alloprevotella tannerae TaxID=76122 RepID=A0A929RXA0_9BACT|nr:YigZ family protein [Alloprevotella tannerae]MBF0970985.1 YigZ family protein [Alloprevotella tannerae]